MDDTIFSEYFLDEVGVKPSGNDKAHICTCVGKADEEFTMMTITKKCRGRVKKSRSKPQSGTLDITMHGPKDMIRELYDMKEFATGVYGYGTESQHAVSLITMKVKDEDDNVEYRAYPAATLNSKKLSIDDDATEVAMLELSFDLAPDDDEMFVYEALESEMDESIAEEWMENFSTELIAATV